MLNEREIILLTTAILCSLRHLELVPGSKEQEEFRGLIFKLAQMRLMLSLTERSNERFDEALKQPPTNQ